jgi:hypothetical protein
MDPYRYRICESCGTCGLSTCSTQVDVWTCSNCSLFQSDATHTQSSSLNTSSNIFPDELLQININSTLDSSTSSSSTITASEESDYLRFIRSCKGATFCHLNANSVRLRYEEINYLLSTVKISGFAITESKLDSDGDSSTQFQVKNYNSVRVDRNNSLKKSGGGILIYIHESFSFEQLDFALENFPSLTEIVMLKLTKANCRPIVLSTLYNNPDFNKAQLCIVKHISILPSL